MDFNSKDIPSQKGKIAIITGANDGLGFETALALCSKEIKVVMACRNLAKAKKAKNEIIEQVPSAELEIMPLDLRSLASVREFVDTYLAKYNYLDLLINNAGIMMPPYSLTKEGFESQLGVNYLGHFLLTGLLFSALEKSTNARVITLSSNAHKSGKINFEDLQSTNHYSPYSAYSQSKLACLMFSYELQRRLQKSGSNIISVAAHPGVSDTNLFHQIPSWFLFIFGWLLKLTFVQSAKKGAEPILYAALGKDIEGGDYIGPDGFGEWKGKAVKVKSNILSKDVNIAQQLWQISEQLTSINFLNEMK